MSSPLKAFRKHQKKLIVIFGVLLMVSFTVLGTVQQFMRHETPEQRAGQEVVATWKEGEITRGELQSERMAQQSAFIFMNALVQEAQNAGGSPQVDVLQGDATLQGLARQIILAKKAEQMGIVVTDDTITQYLSKLTDGAKRSPEQFEAMFEQLMKDRRGVNYKGFLRYMRKALMAQDVLVMGTAGISALSPGEAKSYHDRIYRQKTVELLPLKVNNYLPKVKGKPSQAELEKLYEEGKDRYTTPPSAEPAFRRRHKIKFAYFKGDAETFRTREEAKITDEQIANYYQEHKDDFKRASLPSDLGGDAADETGLPGDKTKPAPADKSSGQPDSSTGSDANAPNESSQPDKSNKTPAAGSSEDKSSEETKDKSEDKDKDATEKKQPASKDDQSRLDGRIDEATVFVSLDDEGAEEKASKEETATPAEKAQGKEDSEKKPEYRPLDEVKDEIRGVLAKEAVAKEYEGKRSFDKEQPFQYLRDQALEKAAIDVQRYARKRNRWIIYQKRGRSGAEKPIEPDWKKIAEKLDLEYGEAPLADRVQIAHTEIGKVESHGTRIFSHPQMERPQFRSVTESFADIAFKNEDEKLFNPFEFPPSSQTAFDRNNPVFYQNPGGVRYLYWKAAEKEESTPPLDKIRNEVTETWRMQQARKLALADAKKKVAEVKGTEKSLTEVFGEDAVLQPGGFRWLSRGGGNISVGGGELTVTEVDQVENPGEKFHQAVSLLEEGETGVATNQDESVVYVVQVERDTLIVPFQRVGSDINRLAMQNQTGIFRDWLEDIDREYNVEWKNLEE